MSPYYSDDWLTVYGGDCRDVLRTLPAESVHCVVTSPPYWQQRAYGSDLAEIGIERTPADYVASLVNVARALRTVLRDDGSLWLNIGDVYAASGKGGGGKLKVRKNWRTVIARPGFRMPPPGYKLKDLTLSPFLVANALREDGWYLRSVIIWDKGVPSEPPRLDRPSTAHEYVFLLAKSEDYAVRNPGPGWWNGTVWRMTPERGHEHPAVMPVEMARRCILAGCPELGTVLDPFAGSGTVGLVAQSLSRRAILIDLNPEYLKQQLARNAQTPLGLSA